MNKHAVVVSLPRTASTLMCEVLAQHPDILGAGEIFCDEEHGRNWFHRKAFGDEDYYKGPDDFIRYMARFEERAGNRLCTWKLMDSQERLAWAFVENNPNVPLIHTHRENVLASYASAEISKTCGAWHGHTDKDCAKAAGVSVLLNPAGLMEWHLRKVALVERLLRLPNQKLHLHYEEFTEAFEQTVSRVFAFLSVPDSPVKLTQQKLNPRPLRERIKNYSSLHAQCLGTELENYFT